MDGGKSLLVCKAVDEGARLCDLFDALTENTIYVFVNRNPIAILDGWMRRGLSVRDASKRFVTITKLQLDALASRADVWCLPFDSVLETPFAAARRIYRHSNNQANALTQLKLKVKPILRSNNEYGMPIDSVDQKMIITHENVRDLIDPNISEIQIGHVSPRDQAIFLDISGRMIEKLDAFVSQHQMPD